MQDGPALKIRLTAPPVDGAANALLLKYLAKHLGIPKSRISVVAGERSRLKRLHLEGVDLADQLSEVLRDA